MAKKARRRRSKPKPVECDKCKDEPSDMLSLGMLPDDVLVSLIIFLTVKEAGITSVLSRRWEKLWMFTSLLDFDATNTLKDMARDRFVYKKHIWSELREVERDKYVKWINKVLQTHQGLTIEGFRVSFDLSKVYQHDIDNWLMFAFKKNVQWLELDLALCNGNLRHVDECYVLSADLLAQKSIFGQAPLTRNGMRSCENSFKSLKSLSLRCVNVTGEVLQCFLSKCPNLERLVVLSSKTLVNFEVSSSSLMLRHLEISYCFKVKNIKISNLNLVSFSYIGSKGVVVLENLPSLVEIRFGIICVFRDAMFELSSYLSQVEILTLDTENAEKMVGLQEFPTLTRLKQLTVIVHGFFDIGIMGFASLVAASPHLKRLVLQTKWYDENKRDHRDIREPQIFKHENLKVVELAGYSGRASELEAAIYVLKNAAALEQLIVDPRDLLYVDNYWMGYRNKTSKIFEKEEAARNLAKQQFKDIVPPHVKLSIL